MNYKAKIHEILTEFSDAIDFALEAAEDAPAHDKDFFDRPYIEAIAQIEQLIREAREEGRIQAWNEIHRELKPGDSVGDYTILERTKNKSQRNRKFRVQCSWCSGVMFRYSNKFKVRHLKCVNWRNENELESETGTK